MELIQLTETAAYLHGGSNAGLILQDGRALLIDTGLDRDAAKKILRALDAQDVKLAAIVITHAHADHFGGAATLRNRTGAPVYAPALEAAIVANPVLEPLYLFSGAWPAAELLHKFTLAEACPVEGIVAPGPAVLGGIPVELIAAGGHAPGQVMVAGGGACFVGDACFAPDVLAKHVIPFCVDVDQALATLARLPDLDGHYAAFVAGHGEAVTAIGPWAAENAARLAEIREAVLGALDETSEVADVLALVAGRMGLAVSNAVTYWLTQTTVLACLRSLQAAGRAAVTVIDNHLCWQAVK